MIAIGPNVAGPASEVERLCSRIASFEEVSVCARQLRGDQDTPLIRGIEILRWQRVRVMANKIESMPVRELQLFAVYMSCSSISHAQLFSYEIAFCASGPREASGAQKDEVLTGGFFAWRSDRHRIDCVVTVPSKE